MKGLQNQLYVVLLIISNLVAILQLVAAYKSPRMAKLSFFVLFAWASFTNWKTSQQAPGFYLEYADLTWSAWYRDFINGWFREHIKPAVGFIATCQGVIAITLLLKGWAFKIGCLAAIVFLVAILPLGIGAGFPCTAIMATAIAILMSRYHMYFAWQKCDVTIASPNNYNGIISPT